MEMSMTAVFPADVGTEMVSGDRPFSSIERASAVCHGNGDFSGHRARKKSSKFIPFSFQRTGGTIRGPDSAAFLAKLDHALPHQTRAAHARERRAVSGVRVSGPRMLRREAMAQPKRIGQCPHRQARAA